MSNEVILDTNAFNSKQMLTELRSAVLAQKITILTSPIVILEYGFYQALHNKTNKFRRLLQELKIQIISTTKKDSFIAIKHSMAYKDDPRGPSYFFRDSLIAALSERLQIPVITNNTNNFKGLPLNLRMTTNEALQFLQNL